MFWKLDPFIQDPDRKELASATLRSIALNYMAMKGFSPPKALLRALNNIKRRNAIIVSKLGKGSGVLIIDKGEYLRRLICEASINHSSKFAHIHQYRPKSRGSQKISLTARERKTAPQEGSSDPTQSHSEQLCPKGSRLAHLHGLLKREKKGSA